MTEGYIHCHRAAKARDSHVRMEEAKHEAFLKPHFPLFSHPFLLRYQPVSYLFFLKLGSFIQFKLGCAPNAMNSPTMILLHSQCHHRRLRCYNFYSFLFTFLCGLLLSLFLCCWTTPPTVCCSSRQVKQWKFISVYYHFP